MGVAVLSAMYRQWTEFLAHENGVMQNDARRTLPRMMTVRRFDSIILVWYLVQYMSLFAICNPKACQPCFIAPFQINHDLGPC